MAPYRADAAALLRYARRLAVRRGVPQSVLDPQDVVHDAFEQMHRVLDGVDNPAAWLRTVVRRRVARAHAWMRYVSADDVDEHLAARALLDGRWTSARYSVEDVLAVREVLDVIARLPDQQRAAVYLRLVHDLPAADVAGRLRIAVGTVGVHVHRAKQAIRDALRDDLEHVREHLHGADREHDMERRLRGEMKPGRSWCWCSCWPGPPQLLADVNDALWLALLKDRLAEGRDESQRSSLVALLEQRFGGSGVDRPG